MEPSQSQAIYRCPLCGESRALADTCLRSSSFEAYHKSCWGHKPDVRDVELWNEHRRDWACNTCIQAGRAIVANYRPQGSVSAFPPAMVVYRDEERNCADCAKAYTFTAREQQRWYEEWRIPLEAMPRACTDCRQARRENRTASLTIKSLMHRAKTAQSLEAMRSLMLIYKSRNKPTKADYWTRIARKTREEKIAELTILIDRVNVDAAAEVERIAALLAETGQAESDIGKDFARRIKGLRRKKPWR